LDVERARGMGVPSGELYKGITASLRRIWTEEGIRGLYRGLGPVMVGYLPTWYVPSSAFIVIFLIAGLWVVVECVWCAVTDGRAVYFPVYEQCKKVYVSPGIVPLFCVVM
jgi:hypothetical protein